MRRAEGGSAPAVDEENHLAALKAFGGTKEQLEEARAALRRRERTDIFEVWPENWRAWELFSAMGTSWNVAITPRGQLVHLGLQWPALDSIERRLPPLPDEDPADLPDQRTLFHQLRILELETLEQRNGRLG